MSLVAYLFAAGERPNPVTSGLISALLFGVVALFALATAYRNTIFQRVNFGSPVSRVKTPQSLIVGMTGTFGFDQEGKSVERRFIDMPAVRAPLENGDPVLASNIDAASRFMGARILGAKRRGIITAVDGATRTTAVAMLTTMPSSRGVA